MAKRVWSVDDLPERYQKQIVGKVGKVRPHPQLEVPFMEQVLEFLRLCGWLAYHTKDSRKSAPGFPDIIALKGERQLVIETKRVGEEPEQEQEGNAYRIVLGEPTLDALQVTWHRRGWVCAHCADAMRDEMPNHDLTCAWWWLMNSWAAVFVEEKGEFRRNRAVSVEHGKMALELLEGAHVLSAS